MKASVLVVKREEHELVQVRVGGRFGYLALNTAAMVMGDKKRGMTESVIEVLFETSWPQMHRITEIELFPDINIDMDPRHWNCEVTFPDLTVTKGQVEAILGKPGSCYYYREVAQKGGHVRSIVTSRGAADKLGKAGIYILVRREQVIFKGGKGR